MAAFGGMIITNKGRALQAKAQTGTQLKYTRIKVGDGKLAGQSIPTLNDLISAKKSLDIKKLEVRPGGKAVVGSMLSNAGLKSGFYFREIGVFAQDPDEGEVLYCYANAGDNAEYIPPEGGPDVIEKYIDAVTIIQNAANVSAVMDESLIYPTKKEMESAIAGITPESIGAETPTGAQAKADAAKKAAEQKLADHANNAQVHVSATDRQEWDGAAAEVSDAPGKELTFAPGLQVVESEQDAPFQMGEVKGRTLVNLVGREGNFDYRTSPLFTFFGTGEIIPASTPVGTKVQKIVCNRTDTAHFGARYELDIDRSKHYVAMAYMDNVSCDIPVYFSIAEMKDTGYTSLRLSAKISKGSGMQYLYATIGPAQMENREKLVYYFRGEGTSGAEFRIGPFAFYEVSQAEYDAIAKMTQEQVAAKYPYVDSMTNVTNPYAIVTGGNLLPPFYYMGAVNGAIVDIQSAYEIDLMTSNTLQFVGIGNMEAQHKTYRIDFDSMGTNVKCYFNELITVNSTPIRQHEIGSSGATIEIGDDTKYIGVFFGNMKATGSYKVKNPILIPGTEPKPFVPQQRSMLAFETELAAHPVDGSNPDTLFMGDDGLPYVLEHWGKVTLEPSNFDNTTTNDQPDGFKQFSIKLKQKNTTNHVALIKFDGTQLTHDTISAPLVKPDSFNVGSGSHGGYVWMTIANSDSGWGKDYKPSDDEIKAYFLGWKMYDTSGADPTAIGTYNRTDGLHKGWTPLQSFDGTKYEGGYNGSGTPNTLPSTANTTYYSVRRTWQPYRLQYLKAKPTVEPVRNYELGATLSEGSNMIEVGSGIVIREKANPMLSNGYYRFNDVALAGTLLKYRLNYPVSIYKDNSINLGWEFISDQYAYGNYKARMDPAQFDPSAIYHVTYTMLDPTLAAPISGTVAANLRGTVSDLVQDVGGIGRRLSVVENSKAEKDAPPPDWIQVSLLNGWVNGTGNDPIAVYRKVGGVVELDGIIKDGTTAINTILFILPKGYRPRKNTNLLTVSYRGGTEYTAVRLFVSPVSGEVRIASENAGNLWFSLTGLRIYT